MAPPLRPRRTPPSLLWPVRHHSTIATPASSVEELSAVSVFYGSRPGSSHRAGSTIFDRGFATFALRAGIFTFELSRCMDASLTTIDRHHGPLARDGREHAIRLLDEHSARERPKGQRATGRHLPGARGAGATRSRRAPASVVPCFLKRRA